MQWIVTKIIKLFIFLTIFFMIGLTAAIFMVNPTHFKSHITKSLQKYTGQDLQINGSINWVIRPITIMHLEDVTLGQKNGSAIQIKAVDIHFSLMSLFKDLLVVNDLELDGLNINLEQAKTIFESATAPQGKSYIQTLTVRNAQLSLQDTEKQLNWVIANATITAKDINVGSAAAIPALNIKGDLTNLNTNVTYAVDTNAILDPGKHSVNFEQLNVVWQNLKVHGNADIEQTTDGLSVTGKATIDAVPLGVILKTLDPYYAADQQKAEPSFASEFTFAYTMKDALLDLHALTLKLDNGTLAGDIKFKGKSPYQAEFNLNANDLDLMPIAQLTRALFPSVPGNKDVFPVDLLKDLTIQGKFSGSRLQMLPELKVEQIDVQVAGEPGTIQFAPVIISAFEGTHNVTINLDVKSNPNPTIHITEQAERINLASFWHLFKLTNLVDGTASIKAELTANGHDLDALKKSIGGGVNMFADNGTLYGIDANQLMIFAGNTINDVFTQLGSDPNASLKKLAVTKASDWINNQSQTSKTSFDHFNFKAVFDQSISPKSSFELSNSAIKMNATGSINLVDESINFDANLISQVDPISNYKTLTKFMKQSALSMTISGTMEKPVFGPNVQKYMTTIIQLTETELENQAISKMVAATPPNSKTAKTASDLFIDSLVSLSG